MPIISPATRRNRKTRFAYAILFAVLSLGALTMLYPFSLMLAGSVIAQVFNTLGSVFTGAPLPIALFIFVVISLIGNALNLALNLLGCYVHDLRLQCLEFFNRFYKEGGVPFSPLAIQTTSVDVIKEEQ